MTSLWMHNCPALIMAEDDFIQQDSFWDGSDMQKEQSFA